ncbi:tryptophan synthase subunit alpha [Dasania marina]|uniref:tryptophan synthase subunit alpha n=1 Tax=Dasania marina TaxID=471499 RepID=UPI00037D4F41|nr:tryptophan synthase subunit alpha [Dasania marina]
MSRIAGCFEKLQQQGRKALIPYIVAGDPSQELTVPLMHKLVEQGANIIEIGVPFSDPMAEGPVIQLAHERALESHTGLRGILAMVTTFRETNNDTPVVLMGYANPVEHMGYQAFASAAHEAGVDGVLTVDIPPEEATPLNTELKKFAIDHIFLIAPTTDEQRIKQIAALATGFVYFVSLKGVTGAGHLDTAMVERKLTKIKAHTSLPIGVGFGIKDADTAAAIAKLAEGVVVGSALVDAVHQQVQKNTDEQTLLNTATQIIADMRLAIDAV